MVLIIAVIVFEMFSLSYLKIFLDQRAVLEIGRTINYDLRNIIQMDSYKQHSFIKYGRWIILVIILYLFGWKIPVGLFIVETILSAIVPVPQQSYQEAMRKFRIISSGNTYLMQLYKEAEATLWSHGVSF